MTPNTRHQTKRAFTLIELLIVLTIIGILTTIGVANFQTARQKARDARRKNDLNQISKALESYYNDHGEYPAATNDGQIQGCGANASQICTWGTSKFSNTSTNPETIYMVRLPADPYYPSKTYYYTTQTTSGKITSYILYARLENTKDPNVPKDARGAPTTYTGTNCSTTSSLECNYAISSPNTTP